MILAAIAIAGGSRAQTSERRRRIGYLSARSAPSELDRAFLESLEVLGYVDGRTIDIEYGWGAGDEARAEQLVASLVARRVEVIVTATTLLIRAAMRATERIPIVMAAAADPVASGLVASLSRPGGNVTGLTLTSNDTGAKRVQLLHELVPAAAHVAVLVSDRGAPDPAINARLLDGLSAAAERLGLTLRAATITAAADLESAFAQLAAAGVHALIVQLNPIVLENQARVIELAARHRLPAMYEGERFVLAGGLVAYGPSLVHMYRRAAGYVATILDGANPGGLPVEQPTVYRLALNLATARALRLAVPAALLARADEVIE